MDKIERKRALREFVERWRAQGHVYGVNDCALFAASWVHALHGADPADDLRGTYSSEVEAAELLAKLGGFEYVVQARLEDLGIAVQAFLGGNNARVGDLVIGELPTRYRKNEGKLELIDLRPCLAVCNGAIAIAPSDGGVAQYAIDRFRGGWHV